MRAKHTCMYCGAENDGDYKGSCPQCPPNAMRIYHNKNELARFKNSPINTGIGIIYEKGIDRKKDMDDTFVVMVTSLLRVMYIANASDCEAARSWQRSGDAREHYTPVAKVLKDVVGAECYEHYIETDEFDWARAKGRS